LKASPSDLHRLDDSWDIKEGFSDVGLASTSTKNLEQEEFGGFLGLPKESFNNNFDPSGDLQRGKILTFLCYLELGLCFCTDRNLMSSPLAVKISSQRPVILPSISLNGQTLPLSSSVQNIMASRGRRGGAPAREDEPRREEQAEQQAPALQGPVLPSPPPVDYGVFMQGLVQAMQTQAHTQATLQAQLEAQQAQVPAQDHGGPSIMERFKRMLPPSFKGESDLLLAESWMREIEKIFRAIRCADDDKVTLATYMLQERADVWWASLLRT
ncbi:hypothetical protein Taro_004307, partial [Colocasia esculenta]|nr:hypothetical protein [Colocasia esculenta]